MPITTVADLQRPDCSRDIATLAFFLMRSGEGGLSGAAHLAAEMRYTRASAIIKAAIPAGSLTGSSWAEELGEPAARDAQTAFARSLESFTCFDRIFAAALKLPDATGAVRVQTAIIEGATPTEAAARPITKLNFSGPLGTLRTSTTICVVSNSVLKMAVPAVVALIDEELRKGTRAAVDRAFLAALAEDVTPTASAGTSAANIVTDVSAALDRLSLGADSAPFVVTTPAAVRHAALKSAGTTGDLAFPTITIDGGSLGGVPIIGSDYLPLVGSPPSAVSLVLDASRLAMFDGGVGLSQATHAALEMSDAPVQHVGGVGSPDAPVATQLVSLWQTNSTGFKADRYWGTRVMSANAVTAISNVAW